MDIQSFKLHSIDQHTDCQGTDRTCLHHSRVANEVIDSKLHSWKSGVIQAGWTTVHFSRRNAEYSSFGYRWVRCMYSSHRHRSKLKSSRDQRWSVIIIALTSTLSRNEATSSQPGRLNALCGIPADVNTHSCCGHTLTGCVLLFSVAIPCHKYKYLMRLLVTEIIPPLICRMLENVHLAGEVLARSIYGP
jgi:hypothetical protein